MTKEEYQSDLQMKDHFDAGLEIKVLDLLLENALLKSQITSSSGTTTMKNDTIVVIDRNAQQQQLKNEVVPCTAATESVRRHQQPYHFKSEECYAFRTPATSDEFSSSFISMHDGVLLTQSSNNVENKSSHSLTLKSFPSSHAIGQQHAVKDLRPRPRYCLGSSIIISSLSKLAKGIRVLSRTKKHPKRIIVSLRREDTDVLDNLSDLSS